MEADGRRPHLLFGTRELMRVHEEPVFLRVRDDDFDKYHPGGEDAVTVDPSDKDVITEYVEELCRINGNLLVRFCVFFVFFVFLGFFLCICMCVYNIICNLICNV